MTSNSVLWLVKTGVLCQNIVAPTYACATEKLKWSTVDQAYLAMKIISVGKHVIYLKATGALCPFFRVPYPKGISHITGYSRYSVSAFQI